MKSVFSLFVSFGILALLIYFSNPHKVMEIFLSSNPLFLAVAFCSWFFSAVLRTVRWKILLRNVGINPSFATAMKVLLAGLAVSNLTPGKVGEPVRAYFLKKSTGEYFSTVVSSIFVERVCDFLAILTLGAFSLFLLFTTPYFTYFVLAVCLYAFLFLFGIYILASGRRTAKSVNFLFKILGFIPKIRKRKSEIAGFSENIHRSFLTYKNWKVIFCTYLITLLIWILESLVFYFAFVSINAQISPFLIVTLSPLLTIISILTFLPGGLGSGDALAVFVYSFVAGLSYSQVTAASLLGRIAAFFPCIAIGMYFASKYKISLKN